MQNIEEELKLLKENNMFRHISPIKQKQGECAIVNGKKLVNFSSNEIGRAHV